MSAKTEIGRYVNEHAVSYGEQLKETNRQLQYRPPDTQIHTAAKVMIRLSLLRLRRVPSRAMSVRDVRHIMTHVVTTTIGPWSLGVMIPCGG